MLRYILIMLITFYFLPLFFAGSSGTAMVLLLIATPIITLVCSLIYGLRHSFHWQYFILIFLAFLPALPIFYNISAFIYSIIFGGIALLGNILGALIRLILLKY